MRNPRLGEDLVITEARFLVKLERERLVKRLQQWEARKEGGDPTRFLDGEGRKFVSRFQKTEVG
jgi:hypothetical protein